MSRMATSCPPRPALVDWFDGLLDAADAARIDEHLDGCAHCRAVLLEWTEHLEGAAPPAAAPAAGACVDDELLVAYGVASTTLAPAAVADVERHLRQCTRCAHMLQRTMRLHRQMEGMAAAEPTPAAAAEPVHAAVPHRAAGFAGVASQWWEYVRALFTPAMWPRAALAAVGVLVLAIGISRFVVPLVNNEPDRVRDAGRAATVELSVDTAGYARPAVDEPVVVQLARGTRARWLETAGDWTRIELADGRRVWVPRQSAAAAREK